MTIEDFENYLFQTRAKLLEKFKNAENVTELDVYTKLVLDYQDQIFKSLFLELNNIQTTLIGMKGDLLKDNRERFEIIMKKLNEDSK